MAIERLLAKKRFQNACQHADQQLTVISITYPITRENHGLGHDPADGLSHVQSK
jgi:hypothetical protein